MKIEGAPEKSNGDRKGCRAGGAAHLGPPRSSRVGTNILPIGRASQDNQTRKGAFLTFSNNTRWRGFEFTVRRNIACSSPGRAPGGNGGGTRRFRAEHCHCHRETCAEPRRPLHFYDSSHCSSVRASAGKTAQVNPRINS